MIIEAEVVDPLDTSTPSSPPAPLPACCIAAAVDLMDCCEAALSVAVLPEEMDERLLEVSARAALYRWLAHCRHHRRAEWGRSAAA